MRAAEDATRAMWPGVRLIPFMGVATTDARFLNNAGIPTYGLTGMFRDDNPGVHGLNEHIAAQSLYDGQQFLYSVVKSLSTRTATE
jgi:acetylornithine deacetylase/succinyl-diaminopimelate desuccinylase-like protein